MATCGNDRFLFIHVPKTGGTWVSQSMKAVGIYAPEERGSTDWHPNLSELERRGRFTFAFVREPLSWYGSIWSFRRKHQYHKHPVLGGLPYDQFIELDFPDFVEQVAENLPGFLSTYYEQWVGSPDNEIDFIGRYENLKADFVSALWMADQDFDGDGLGDIPPINPSAPAPPCPRDIRNRLMRSEQGVYERFYRAELAANA